MQGGPGALSGLGARRLGKAGRVAKCPYKEASYKPFVRCRNACGLRDALVAPFNRTLGLRPRVLFTEPRVRHVNHAPTSYNYNLSCVFFVVFWFLDMQ